MAGALALSYCTLSTMHSFPDQNASSMVFMTANTKCSQPCFLKTLMRHKCRDVSNIKAVTLHFSKVVALLCCCCSVLVPRPAAPPLCSLCPPSWLRSCLKLAVHSIAALFFPSIFFFCVLWIFTSAPGRNPHLVFSFDSRGLRFFFAQ